MTLTASSMVIRHRIIILSPLIVLGMSQLTIRLFASVWGVWSWLPFWLFYILLLGFFIHLNGVTSQIPRWLAASPGHWIWPVVACVIPVSMTLPIFIPNWRLLMSPQILFWTLLFVAINPFMEEFYWRGTLLDATSTWPGWLSIAYSVTGFALNHLWIGVIAVAGRHPSALAGPILMGTIWALTYKATGRLRWSVIGHFLANVFSLSVPVFLNLFFPLELQVDKVILHFFYSRKVFIIHGTNHLRFDQTAGKTSAFYPGRIVVLG